MDYKECVEWLYKCMPPFQMVGRSGYKPGMESMRLLDAFLGSPHKNIKTIHVAGTNGKGSVCNNLCSILMEDGNKVGLFTSPHLRDFRERIKVNGEMISEAEVCEFVDTYRVFLEALLPSFFEVTTAMAFWYFSRQKVDFAVIEVGLGGRLDSTNVISPLLCVVTNISYDHMNLLGDTLEKIAYEKAGIMKKDTPCVIGRADGGVKRVFEECAEKTGAKAIFCDIKDAVDVDIPDYQIENRNTVRTAVKELRKLGYKVSDEAVERGFANVYKNTNFSGRWQTLSTNPLVIADCAHNEDGITKAVHEIGRQKYKTLRIVFGACGDKDVEEILNLLPKDAIYYFAAATTKRAIPSDQMKEMAAAHGLTGKSCGTVQNALATAKKEADADDFILVFGSCYVVGEVV